MMNELDPVVFPDNLLFDELVELRFLGILYPDDVSMDSPESQFLADVPEYRFAIHRRIDGLEVGSIDLRVGDGKSIIDAVGHVGYKVDESHRRNGYAGHAIRLIIKVGRYLNIAPLWVFIDPEDIASRRAAERAGFHFVDEVNTYKEAMFLGLGPRVCRFKSTPVMGIR